MEYNFREIQIKWQKYWKENKTYKVEIDKSKPKYYVLDMFPYPSGAGLHVGHPLGYIASDIYSRYKTHRGFNVLHPMGYDAFGLPAEQYAIQTGTHPAITTEKNIQRYREQLDNIGFSYDWDREIRTCDPNYYKWTQWVVIQLFKHYYDNDLNRANPIKFLEEKFAKYGSFGVNAVHSEHEEFTAEEWQKMDFKKRQEILMNYRLMYLSEAYVNWCPKLGTVLANDEVTDGFSVRGGYPVERKKMKQWLLRITAYAQRLLDGFATIDWPEPVVEIQTNWIGRSEGATIFFEIVNSIRKIEVFTTRPDTIYGATFMVLAPEHEMSLEIASPEYKQNVSEYIQWAKNRSEVERMAEKKVSGQFTGSYAINPFTKQQIPVYIADYVLIGYGTGAIMAVPAHDSRDFAFARHFNLPIIQVVKRPNEDNIPVEEWTESYDSKEGIMINSGIINGLEVKDAIKTIIKQIEESGIGKKKVNYRLRDAIFGRQRYWGEPIPIYYKDGIPHALSIEELPLELPEIDKFLPTEEGEPPLARAKNWKTFDGYPLETSTMPGFAGSSGYYLRYMDPHNEWELVSEKAVNYWHNVDLYIGGREHATGHLIYARFWNKFLYDLGLVPKDEPFQKLVNQGMIQGRSNFVYRITGTNTFVSYNLKDNYETQKIHVDINIVNNDILDIDKFRKWQPEFENAEFILEEDGKYHCGWEIEKMSKSMHNVQNPDDIVEKYGADTLRIYEMFLGPIEQAKPWDTNGIEGAFRFLRKFWRLFFNNKNEFYLSDEQPDLNELKILHKTIKKVSEDIEKLAFNTAISTLMICVNELNNCNKRKILEPLCILMSPFAPHIAEELWHLAGHKDSVTKQNWPIYNDAYTQENSFSYPISFNGKTRFNLDLGINLNNEQIKEIVLSNENSKKWIEGKEIVKIIIVPRKIVNIVVK
ncbi:MAG TPA: leucine--tRNA ligase [Bacteroidales bacterium]|nr:leucine--tRNA ligase [Bacteroidales bacterium]HOL97312.1 leucine--tRNA ligase [Bacteroidales bacterium]HUM31647.1 leucine--tRNA ligase [Bacteroidales bacterium]